LFEDPLLDGGAREQLQLVARVVRRAIPVAINYNTATGGTADRKQTAEMQWKAIRAIIKLLTAAVADIRLREKLNE
jgi:hypothetical protein